MSALSDIFADKPEETLELKFDWTTEDIKHFWFAISDYNGYRVKEGLDPLAAEHPLMRAQYRITASLGELIAAGLRDGKNVADLLEIKYAIDEGEELQDG